MSKNHKTSVRPPRPTFRKHSNEVARKAGGLSLATVIIVVLCVLVPFAAAISLSRTALFTYWPGAAHNQEYVSWNFQNGPYVVFGGPYYQLRQGSYIADFQLKLFRAPSETPLVRLEVIAHSNGVPNTFTRDVRLHGIQKSELVNYSVSFDLTRTSVIETRLYSYGNVDGLARVIRVRTADTLELSEDRNVYIGVAACGLLAYAWLLMGNFPQRIHPRILLGVHLVVIAVLTIMAGMLVGGGRHFEPAAVFWVVIVIFAGTLVLLMHRSLPPEIYRLMMLGDAVTSFLALVMLIGLRSNWNGIGCVVLATCASKAAFGILGLSLSSRRQHIRIVAVIGLYTFGSLWFWYNQYPLSGDQWSYLLETVSLLRHQSINTLEALQHGDHREFARDLPASVFLNDSLTLKGRPGYPTRDLGLSFFLTPAYALGRVPMARLGMAIGAILLMTVLFKLLIECGFSNGVTAFSCAAVMFSLPILHFSQVFYPELMGALLTVCGFALLRAKPGIRSMLLLGLIVGLLPLFNARYWVIAGPLTLLGVFRHTMFQDKRFLAALLAPAVTVFVAIVILNFAVYGLALPNAGYIYLTRGANLGIYNSSIPAFTGDFYRGLAGIIFDQNSGLMTTAPVFILALTGFVALWKRNKRVCLQIIVVSGLYFIAVAGTRLWRGGPTPTPRFLVPIIPILALPLAAIFEDCRSTVLRIVACALIAIGTLTSLASLTSLDGDYIPTRLAARMIDAYGFSIASILPSFDHNAPETFWLTSIWILIVVGLVWWVSRTTHSREKQVPE